MSAPNPNLDLAVLTKQIRRTERFLAGLRCKGRGLLHATHAAARGVREHADALVSLLGDASHRYSDDDLADAHAVAALTPPQCGTE